MMTSSFFSAPVTVIINQRLVSQRGGIVPPAQQSEDSLCFKLFMNSNPSSARYGLTLQISATREMSKEHNVDQIPEHQACIFFPTKSLFHYSCVTPTRTSIHQDTFEEMGIDEAQAHAIDRTVRAFWIKGDANFDELRHLRFCCWNALADNTSVPKLRSEGLESELKRIFSTVNTANEINNACLEIDCLLLALVTTNGETDKAVWAMHRAAQKDLEGGESNKGVRPNKQSALGKKSWRQNISMTKLESKQEGESVGKQYFQKFAVPAKIDGKFISSDEISTSRRGSRQTNMKSYGSSLKTSPNKYLHPHTFDSNVTYYNNSPHDDIFNPQGATSIEETGSQRGSWRDEE